MLDDGAAFEVVHPTKGGKPNECTAEVEVDKLGTVVLPKPLVNAKESLPTGWPDPLQPGVCVLVGNMDGTCEPWITVNSSRTGTAQVP